MLRVSVGICVVCVAVQAVLCNFAPMTVTVVVTVVGCIVLL